MSERQDEQELFPEALIKWAGHRDGGVRLPFNNSSGRPTGKQIKTPLVKRLASWATGIVSDSTQPHIILLVGGPGNGKTDAIEGCIYSLEHSLGENCGLVEKFEEAYHVEGASVPPRKVSVSTVTLDLDSTKIPFTEVHQNPTTT